jgi:hypothetical protein
LAIDGNTKHDGRSVVVGFGLVQKEQDSKGVFRRHKILSFSVLSVDSRSPAGVTIRGYGRGYDFQPISTVVALTSHYNNRTSSINLTAQNPESKGSTLFIFAVSKS